MTPEQIDSLMKLVASRGLDEHATPAAPAADRAAKARAAKAAKKAAREAAAPAADDAVAAAVAAALAAHGITPAAKPKDEPIAVKCVPVTHRDGTKGTRVECGCLHTFVKAGDAKKRDYLAKSLAAAGMSAAEAKAVIAKIA